MAPRPRIQDSAPRPKKGERNCTPSVERRMETTRWDRGMGSAWIVIQRREYLGFVGDIASAIHDENFSKGSNTSAGDVSARIGEQKKRKKSIRYRRFRNSEVVEEVSRRSVAMEHIENYFFIGKTRRKEESSLDRSERQHLRIDDTCDITWNRWYNRYSARFHWFFRAASSFNASSFRRHKRFRHDSCASLCAYIDSSGITLFWKRVLHHASSHVARVAWQIRVALYILYLSVHILVFVPSYFTLLYATSTELYFNTADVLHDEKLSLL